MKTQILYTVFPLMAGFVMIALMNSCDAKPVSEPVTDIDGNVYETVRIGNQVWMAENLKTTRYNDGASIAYVINDNQWGSITIGAYCLNYRSEIYGALYNWYAVNSGKLCPEGWRVPTAADWIILTEHLGGEEIAGGKLKATDTLEASDGLWHDPNKGATNETGFSALPGGSRSTYGTFDSSELFGHWWSSSENSSTDGWAWHMRPHFTNLYRDVFNKSNGFSVRCLRDDPTIFDEDSLLHEHLKNNKEELPLELDFIIEEDIPITRQEMPPPPPPTRWDITGFIFLDDQQDLEIELQHPETESKIFSVVENQPEFPGGVEARQQFLRDNLMYPEKAREAGIQGTVFVTFVVEKDGSFTDIRIIRGIGGGCDEEAVRLVKMMPRWEPGRQTGKTVRVQYNLPIRFRSN